MGCVWLQWLPCRLLVLPPPPPLRIPLRLLPHDAQQRAHLRLQRVVALKGLSAHQGAHFRPLGRGQRAAQV